MDLVYDTELAVAAGSDTTANTLAAAVFLLAKHPDKQRLLQEEIDRLVLPTTKGLSVEELSGASFLDGCINEALRLYPAVPSGMQRLTPPEGARPGDDSLHSNVYNSPRYVLMIPCINSTLTNLVLLLLDPRNFQQTR
jgi:hypothetical protein